MMTTLMVTLLIIMIVGVRMICSQVQQLAEPLPGPMTKANLMFDPVLLSVISLIKPYQGLKVIVKKFVMYGASLKGSYL